MPTANSVLVDACTSGLACLGKRDLRVAIAQAFLAETAEATPLQDACITGIACLGHRELMIVMAQGLVGAI